jgi:hypothetical protein
LLVLLVEQLVLKLIHHGLYYTICVEEAWTQELGTESAAVFGRAILTSYLFLFINFYGMTYNKKQTATVGTRQPNTIKKSKRF